MLDWDPLIELILNSIGIIGVFIAIIIGLVISKVMDLKNEKTILKDSITDLNNELEITKEHFEQLKNVNYNEYEEEVIYEMIDAIYKQKEYEFVENYPYVKIEYQKKFYKYVGEYILKVLEQIELKKDICSCKKDLEVIEDSIEEIIIDDIYERNGCYES